MWAIVAMLAVMKAGAGFVSLDPSHPIDRLSFIIEQTEAKVVLGDASKIGRVDGLVERQITVNDGWFDDHRTVPTFMSPKPNVSPDDIAFLLFTSGSTGVCLYVTDTTVAANTKFRSTKRHCHNSLQFLQQHERSRPRTRN